MQECVNPIQWVNNLDKKSIVNISIELSIVEVIGTDCAD